MMEELAKGQNGFLVLLICVGAFALGFGIGYAFGRAWGMY